MTVLVLLPNPHAGSEVVSYWKNRLTDSDRLHVVSFGSEAVDAIHGVEVRYLELDGARTRLWRPRLIRGIGWRLMRSGVHLWEQYLSEIWDEFLWNIRSYDPDLIDARALPNRRAIQKRLRNARWNVIVSPAGVPPLDAVNRAWRQYDPARKVSIVLPVYNGEAYLRQSIQSCLDQTHRNIELVIVDDCSTDRSGAIIDDYRQRDSRVVAVRNDVNRRLPGALNVGFAATTGDLLSWTSHDNYYAPNAIANLVEYLCTWPDIDFVYSAYRIVDPDGRLEPKIYYRAPPWRLAYENVVGPYFLYRRSVCESLGEYREDMEYSEDYDYWARTYKSHFKMMALPHPLYYYRHHSDSMTAQAAKMAEKPHSGDRVRREHFAVATSVR